MTATANVKTNFMGLMGFSTMKVARQLPGQVGQHPAARRAGARQHRLDGRRRQDAGAQHRTKSLLTQLKTAAVNNGDVYVSIVPFVKDVNVGASNYKATWIDWTDLEREQRHLQQIDLQRQPSRAVSLPARPGRRPTTTPGTAASTDRGNSKRRAPATTTPTSPRRPPASPRRCIPAEQYAPARRSGHGVELQLVGDDARWSTA